MAPKNILLLIADDLGRYIGSYDNTSIAMPNLDALADSGVLFTHAFTSTASCSGSRSVIYTGQHTHQNGQYGLNNGRHHFTTFDWMATAPELFNEFNYLTGIIGNVHIGPDYVYPWQVREENETRNVAWVADPAGTFFEKAKEEGKSFFLTVGYIDPHRDQARGGFGNYERDVVKEERLKDIKQYRPEDVTVPSFLSDLLEVIHNSGRKYQFPIPI